MLRWAGRTFERDFLAAAALLVLAFAAGVARPVPAPELWVPAYYQAGEELYHGVLAEEPETVSSSMPLSSLSAAVFFSHGSPRRGVLSWKLTVAGLLILSCCLAMLSGSALAGAASLAATLWLIPTLSSHQMQMGYSLLLLLAAGMLVRYARRPSPANGLRVGTAVAASVLYRSPLALFPAVLALWDWRRRARHPDGRAIWTGLLPATMVAASLLPWLHLNWVLHGRLIALERGRVQTNLVLGVLGMVRSTDADWTPLLALRPQWEEGDNLLGWALAQVGRHPLGYALSCLRRLAYAVSFHPWLCLSLLLAAWASRRRPETQALGLLAAYFLAVHSTMAVYEAYLYPLWPLLAGAACASAFLALSPSRPAQAKPPPAARLACGVLDAGLALAAGFSLLGLLKVESLAWHVRRGGASGLGALRAAAAYSPRDSWLLHELGRLCLKTGDLSCARDSSARALAARPGDLRLRFEHARVAALTGQPGLLMALEPDPHHVDVSLGLHFLKASELLDRGRRPEARREVLEGLALWESSLHLEEWASVPDKAAALAKLRPSPPLLSSIGEHIAPLPERRRAALLREIAAAASRPHFVFDVWEALAELAQRSGDAASAGRYLDRAQALGLAPYERLQIERLRAALRPSGPPPPPQAASPIQSRLGRRLDEARRLARLGRVPEARSLLESALEASPSPRETRRAALIFQDLGDPKQALRLLLGLERDSPGDASLLQDIGVCLSLMGDRAGARAKLEAALRLDPGLVGAALTLGALYSEEGQGGRALQVYERAWAASGEGHPLRALLRRARTEAAASP